MLSTREGLRVYIKIESSGSSLCGVTVWDEFGFTVYLQRGRGPNISPEFAGVSNLISLSCPKPQMESQAQSLEHVVVLSLYSLLSWAVLHLPQFILALIYPAQICFQINA